MACHFREGKWNESDTALCIAGQKRTLVSFPKAEGFRIDRFAMTEKHNVPLGFRGKAQQKRSDLKKKPITMTINPNTAEEQQGN